MAIDFTITIGNIIEIISIVGGGLLVLITLRADVKTLKSGANSLSVRMDGFQAEMKKFGEILVDLANVRGELKVLDARITAAEQDIRELRHGDGFIKGPRGVDREYK